MVSKRRRDDKEVFQWDKDIVIFFINIDNNPVQGMSLLSSKDLYWDMLYDPS